MGLDGMRVAGGRCPPIVVGILFVVSFLLVCNWWNLSTENTELLLQIDQLHEELKISLDERDEYAKIKENIEKQQKQAEDELGGLHIRIQQQNEEKKKADEVAQSLVKCKSELDSLNKLDAIKSDTLESLRREKDVLNESLNLKRDEAEKIQKDLEKTKNELDELNKICNIRGTQKIQDAGDNTSKEAMSNNGREEGMDDQRADDIDAEYSPIPDDPRFAMKGSSK